MGRIKSDEERIWVILGPRNYWIGMSHVDYESYRRSVKGEEVKLIGVVGTQFTISDIEQRTMLTRTRFSRLVRRCKSCTDQKPRYPSHCTDFGSASQAANLPPGLGKNVHRASQNLVPRPHMRTYGVPV